MRRQAAALVSLAAAQRGLVWLSFRSFVLFSRSRVAALLGFTRRFHSALSLGAFAQRFPLTARFSRRGALLSLPGAGSFREIACGARRYLQKKQRRVKRKNETFVQGVS